MKAETLVVQVADLPVVKEHIERLEWRVECLEQMLRSPFCGSCGSRWATSACGPTHAAIAACHPDLSDSCPKEGDGEAHVAWRGGAGPGTARQGRRGTDQPDKE